MKCIYAYKDVADTFISIYVSMYLLFSFFLLFLPATISNTLRIFLLMTAILLCLISICKKHKLYLSRSLRLMLLLCFFYIINQILNFRSPLSVLYPLGNCFLGYMVCNNKINLKILYLSFIVISSFLLYFMINLYDPNLIFNGGSRNLISVVLLYMSLIIYFQEMVQKKKFHLFPAIITLLLSIWAVGRSGIICSLFLFVIISSFKYKQIPISRKILYISFVFFPLIYLLVVNMDSIDLFIRFQERGVSYNEDERSIMLYMYLSHINLITFFFGYDYFSDNSFAIWDFNVHNSFISFHSLWGIGAILMILLLIKHLWLLKDTNLILVFFIGLFLLRAFSDGIAFNGMYDFVLVSMILYSYSDEKQERLQNRLY